MTTVTTLEISDSSAESVPDLSLSSRRLILRPVIPNDYPFLYELSTSPSDFHHWRFRGQQPGFEEFVRLLHAEVCRQYMVVRKTDGQRLGLVVCYQATFRNRYARIALQGARSVQGAGALMEAGRLLVDFLFRCYDFEKLYAECPAFNMVHFRSGLGGLFIEEGCLREHERFFGRSWDLHLLALYRQQWEGRAPDIEVRIARRLADRPDMDVALSFEEFCEIFQIEFDLERGEVRPESRLVDDLGFDSIQLYELLCMVEEMGSFIQDFVLDSVVTVDDLFFYYVQNRE